MKSSFNGHIRPSSSSKNPWRPFSRPERQSTFQRKSSCWFMMRCFSACFSACKHKKRRPLVDLMNYRNQRYEVGEAFPGARLTLQELSEETIPLSKGKLEEPLCCGPEKNVPIDLIFGTKEEAPTEKVTDNLIGEIEEQEHNGEPIKPFTEFKEKLEEPLSCSTDETVSVNLSVKTKDESPAEKVTENLVGENEEKCCEKEEETTKESKSVSNPVTLTTVSYPPNRRYQNCANSEDESDLGFEEESELGDGNIYCDGDNGKRFVMEETSESLFSLSIESRTQASDLELGEKEVTSPMPKCSSPVKELKMVELNQSSWNGSQFVDSVLNPVENLIEWKAGRQKPIPSLKHQEKENIISEHDCYGVSVSEEPDFKLSTGKSKPSSKYNQLADQGMAVDTSLSSWLVESETTPSSRANTNSVGHSPFMNSKSPRNHEDRPILGALTMEELIQHSASISPKPSRSRSPDDTPIIGTVGSYWSHTGENLDSDSSSPSKGMPKTSNKKRKDQRVKWNPIPFEGRLERALHGGTAEV